MRRVLVLPAIAALVIAVTSFALFARIGNAPDTLSRARRSGRIRIGYAAEAPYAFVTATGEVSGADPELAKRVAAKLGIRQIDWVQTDFDDLIPDLNAGRFDVIAAGMFVTRERAKAVRFSAPTLHVREGLLVPTGNPRGLHSYEQALAHPAAPLAVLSGSVEAQILVGLGAKPAQLVYVPDAGTGLAAVKTGTAEALALSAPTLRWMTATGQKRGVALAEPFEQPKSPETAHLGYSAFAFREEDSALCEAWNAVLRPLMGSWEHRDLIKAFGFGEADMPDRHTAAEVLGS